MTTVSSYLYGVEASLRCNIEKDDDVYRAQVVIMCEGVHVPIPIFDFAAISEYEAKALIDRVLATYKLS